MHMGLGAHRGQRLNLGVLEKDAMVRTLLILEGAEELVEVVEGRLDSLLLRWCEGELAVLQEAAQVHFEEGAWILCDRTCSALHPLHLDVLPVLCQN